MTESARAAILLDVDGPLNPYPRPSGPPPPGYHPYLLQHSIIAAIPPVEQRVLLNTGLGRQLLDLAESTDAELVWATAWEYAANTVIAPVLGLPPLEVIIFEDTGIRHRNGHHGKLPTIERWARRRPFCWFDDEFQSADQHWAQRRTADGAPTMLIPVDRHTGLAAEHLDRARTFLQRLAAA